MKSKTCMIGALLALLGVSSCNDDYLDQTVITDLNEEVVFADSTYASGFLTQIYTDIGFDTDGDRFSLNGGLQVASDEAEFRASSQITTGMMFATGTLNPVTVTSSILPNAVSCAHGTTT